MTELVHVKNSHMNWKNKEKFRSAEFNTGKLDLRETLDTEEQIIMTEVTIRETEDRKIYDESNLFCIWRTTDFTDNNFKEDFFKGQKCFKCAV